MRHPLPINKGKGGLIDMEFSIEREREREREKEQERERERERAAPQTFIPKCNLSHTVFILSYYVY